MSEPRSYVAGLPVIITVHDDGKVEYEIDKSESTEGMEEHAPEEYTEAQIAADVAIVEAHLQAENVKARVLHIVNEWPDEQFEATFGFSRDRGY